jgi:hypothetical protein
MITEGEEKPNTDASRSWQEEKKQEFGLEINTIAEDEEPSEAAPAVLSILLPFTFFTSSCSA